MSSVESDLYGFLNLPPNRPIYQKRVVSASDRYPYSSLPVSSSKGSSNIPKRPAADVIDQVHRRLSGNHVVSGGPSAIPLFRVQEGGVGGYEGKDERRDERKQEVKQQQQQQYQQRQQQPRQPQPQPQLHPNQPPQPRPPNTLRNKQNLRTRASIIGDNYSIGSNQPSNFSSNNPFRNVSSGNSTISSTNANSGFVNPKSRRRSIVMLNENTEGIKSTYAAPPNGMHPSISSRRPERLSMARVGSVPVGVGSSNSSNSSINSTNNTTTLINTNPIITNALPPHLSLPPNHIKKSRISMSPQPNGPRRLGKTVPPVPPLPDSRQFIRPKRSFSNEIPTHSVKGSISSSISMSDLHSPVKVPLRYLSPQKERIEYEKEGYRGGNANVSYQSHPQQHHQLNLPAQQQPLPNTNNNPFPKSQTLPDIARLNLEPPDTTSPNYLSTKSPYRPLNRPAKIHPRPNQLPNKAPSITTTTNSDSSDSPNSPQSKTAIGEYSINITPASKTSLTTPNIRSKSTASKQFSGQTSVAATRRMLLSPYENFKRLSQISTASVKDYPPPPVHLIENYNPPIPSLINLSEIKMIMKSLRTNKRDVEEANRIMEELQSKKELTINPMTPAVASKRIPLNTYEQGEILDFRHVYYCGQAASNKITGDIRLSEDHNYGFDDDNGDYKVTPNDHIAYKYRILSVLGKGSFGKVLKCIDHSNGKLVALKMIMNHKRLRNQALVESHLLKSLSTWDSKNQYHIVKYLDHFNFREHLCITSELLGINLYELIKYNNYKGLPIPLIRHFTFQVLEALAFLDSKSIIHCDLKPENIMLSDTDLGKIKIIDFGSSCYESEKVYTYIQSRFYRSPEVMLGMPYGRPVDIWSLGCIIPELLTGRPLFMGEDENEQVGCIMEVFGVPDRRLISRCSRRRLFFDNVGKPKEVVTKRGQIRKPNSKKLNRVVKSSDPIFLDFLSQLLAWDPKKRPRPYQALKHEFLVGKPIRSTSSSSSSSHSHSIKASTSSNSISSMTSLSSIKSTTLPNSSANTSISSINSLSTITPTPSSSLRQQQQRPAQITTGPRKQPPSYSYIRRA